MFLDKRIFKKVGGTPTELATGDSGITASDVLRLDARNSGTTLELFQNGSAITGLNSIDTALTASGRAGIGLGSAWVATDDIRLDWEFDDFSRVDVTANLVAVLA